MGVLGVGVRAYARALCSARTCLRWEECVVWEEGGWGPRGKRCGAFQKDRFLWEISPEIKVLSAEIRVRKYTYNRREILVWAKFEPTTSGRGGEKTRIVQYPHLRRPTRHVWMSAPEWTTAPE